MGKLTLKKVKIAAKNTGGVLTMVAKKLGVARITLYKFIKKHPEIRDILEQERQAIIDYAEVSLFSQVQNKEAWATKYVLSTIGKNRGYYEKREIDNKISPGVEESKRLTQIVRELEEIEDGSSKNNKDTKLISGPDSDETD